MSVNCLACGSTKMQQVEAVSIESVAEAWSKEKAHGASITFEDLRSYISSDLESGEIEFWKCYECDLEMARPMRAWRASHYPVESQGLGFDHQVALLELASIAPTRVLEIGCSNGHFLHQVQLLGHEAIGIDFSEESVLAARARGVDARVAEVENLRQVFSDEEEFDVITLFQIIEHLIDPAEVFSQINELAAKRASLIVGCPSDKRYSRLYNHPQRIDRSDFWDYPPQHTLRWTPQALETFLLRQGWSTERVLYEPLKVLAAAAHMTALCGVGSEWYARGGHRRLITLKWIVRMAEARFMSKATGIRLLIKARRSS